MCTNSVEELNPHKCAHNIHTNVGKLSTLKVDEILSTLPVWTFCGPRCALLDACVSIQSPEWAGYVLWTVSATELPRKHAWVYKPVVLPL